MVMSEYNFLRITIDYEYSGCIINRNLIKNGGMYSGKMNTSPCIPHYPVQLHINHSVSQNWFIISVKPKRVFE